MQCDALLLANYGKKSVCFLGADDDRSGELAWTPKYQNPVHGSDVLIHLSIVLHNNSLGKVCCYKEILRPCHRLAATSDIYE